MADNRLSVKITVVGSDGKERKIDWYVNWDKEMSTRIFDAVVELAKESHLDVNEWV